MSKATTVKQQEKNQSLDQMVTNINSHLGSWNSYVEEIQVPSDLYPALMTGRPELLAIIQPRALTKEECAKIYKLLEVLIKTNMELQEHAQETARMVHTWAASFKQLESVGRKIEQFANFKVGSLQRSTEEDAA